MATSTQEHGSPPVFVTYPELRDLGVRYSRKHLLDLMRDGQFPQARQMSANRIAWLRDEILDYLETRPVARAAQSERKQSEAASERAEVMPPVRAATSPPTVAEARAIGALPADADFLDDDDFLLGLLPGGGFVTWTPPRRRNKARAADEAGADSNTPEDAPDTSRA